MSQDPSEKSRILIVDDHPLFREGLQQLLNRDSSLTMCGEASDAAEAMQRIAARGADGYAPIEAAPQESGR